MITPLRSATAKVSTAANTSTTLTFTLNAGETGVLGFSLPGNGGTLTSYAVVSISGGGTWTKQAQSRNTATLPEDVEVWTTGVGAAVAATSLTITWTRGDSTAPAVITAEAYSGVAAIGNTAVANITTATTTPSVSLTTQDADNYVVAAFCYGSTSSAAAATANTGNLRNQGNDGTANAVDTLGVLNDNTAATASAVLNRITGLSRTWQVAAVELRSTTGASSLVDDSDGASVALLLTPHGEDLVVGLWQ